MKRIHVATLHSTTPMLIQRTARAWNKTHPNRVAYQVHENRTDFYVYAPMGAA